MDQKQVYQDHPEALVCINYSSDVSDPGFVIFVDTIMYVMIEDVLC